jgi:hypothetical protein
MNGLESFRLPFGGRVMDVHVVWGVAAAGTVKLALGLQNDGVVALRDTLSTGPLTSFSSLDAWATSRLGFLRDDLLYEDVTADEVVPDLTVLTSSRVITVWLGTGAADQLALAWLCTLMRVMALDLARLRVIQLPFDFIHGRRHTSLGALNPNQIRQHPSTVELSRSELATLDDAWAAVTADTPEALVKFTRSSNAPLPILRRALQELVSQYPDVDSGLSRWDNLLLRSAATYGPNAVHVVARTMTHGGWDNEPVGDIWLYWRLRRLGSTSLPHPLLDLSGDPGDIPKVSVRVTNAGHAVIRSETTALKLNGIEDHVGGVHLSSKLDRVWLNDKGSLIRIHQHPTPAA